VPATYYLSWNSIALAAATAKTILELPTPANTSIELLELVIGCDVSSAGSLKIEMGTFTTSSTGGTAATPQKWQGDRTIDSAIVAAEINTSATEPTTFTPGTLGGLLYPGLLVPLPALPFFQWPLGREFSIAESLNFGIRLTSSVAGNTMGWLVWEE
jgi:hypothetical protein